MLDKPPRKPDQGTVAASIIIKFATGQVNLRYKGTNLVSSAAIKEKNGRGQQTNCKKGEHTATRGALWCAGDRQCAAGLCLYRSL